MRVAGDSRLGRQPRSWVINQSLSRFEKVIKHQFNRQYFIRPKPHMESLTRGPRHTSTNQLPASLAPPTHLTTAQRTKISVEQTLNSSIKRIIYTFPPLPAGFLGPSTALSTVPAIPSFPASNWLPIAPSLSKGPPTACGILPRAPSGLKCFPIAPAEERMLGFCICYVSGCDVWMGDWVGERGEMYLVRNSIGTLIRAQLISDLCGLICHAGCGVCGGAEELVLEGLCGLRHFQVINWNMIFVFCV